MGYNTLIHEWIRENQNQFALVTLYLFGICKMYIYYKLNFIEIIEYSSFYDFLLAPFSDFLLIIIFLLFLVEVVFIDKKKIENQKESIEIEKNTIKSKTIELVDFLIKTFCIVLMGIFVLTGLFSAFIIFSSDFNWLKLVLYIFLLLILFMLGVSINAKEKSLVEFFYIIIFVAYSVSYPILQTICVNTGEVYTYNKTIINFKYNDKPFSNLEDYIYLGSNSNYIFLKENKKQGKSCIFSKDKCADIEYYQARYNND